MLSSFIYLLFTGGDQGGSIRIPASNCGIVGLKPTHGLVPYTGAVPIVPCLDHLGPMAQNVADCALLLEVIAGTIFSDHFFIFVTNFVTHMDFLCVFAFLPSRLHAIVFEPELVTLY